MKHLAGLPGDRSVETSSKGDRPDALQRSKLIILLLLAQALRGACAQKAESLGFDYKYHTITTCTISRNLKERILQAWVVQVLHQRQFMPLSRPGCHHRHSRGHSM